MARAVRQEYRVDGLGEPISHYTDAVRFGDVLYVSGVAPTDENQRVVGGDDVAAQARQIFVNLEKILKTAGAGFEDVLKVTVYMTDVEERRLINPVRQEYFGKTRPASTLIGVTSLAIPGMKVEIEAVVGLPRRPPKRNAARKRARSAAGAPGKKSVVKSTVAKSSKRTVKPAPARRKAVRR
jgi:2-iminobutanoate/2-iminopropanoate deaminase